jgi:ABC-type glycerol-3-phosphate transport system permease component
MNILFLILLSTVMLPPQVTLIPAFILFKKIGWYDTFLPLIVPAFFANAWDVFLLRQFFMTLPTELDDAARIDGAGPFGILWHVIIPQSYPVIATVTIFSILYAWNDFYAPLIYLQSQEHWTIALGLQSFNAIYSKQGHLLMAASALMLIPPVLLFFFAQKLFIQGVVVSGIKG